MERVKKIFKAVNDHDEEEDDDMVSIVHVSIPAKEDDFPDNLRSVPSFKALLRTYLPACDAFVVLPWLSQESIIVPRQWIVVSDDPKRTTGRYRLKAGATTDDGRKIGGEYTPATVIEELDNGETLVLLLTDFDPSDWFSAYAVCRREDFQQDGDAHVCLACKCSHCLSLFCPQCSGYGENVNTAGLVYPGSILPLPMTLGCEWCVDDMEWLRCPEDAESKRGIIEKHFVEAWQLINARHDFDLLPIPANGSCLIVACATLVEVPVLPFCKSLASFAKKWSADADNEPFFVPDHNEDGRIDKRNEFADMWLQVQRRRTENTVVEPIVQFWNASGGDVILKLIGDYLYQECGKKQLRIYEVNKRDGSLYLGSSFPEVDFHDDPVQSINLVRWNPILPHYDALRPRQP